MSHLQMVTQQKSVEHLPAEKSGRRIPYCLPSICSTPVIQNGNDVDTCLFVPGKKGIPTFDFSETN